MKFNVFCAALCMSCIATIGYSEERVLMKPAITNETTSIGLDFWLIEPGLRNADVVDRYEKDPFDRGAEYDVYKYTTVSCNLSLYLENNTGFDVAFKNPFTTVIGLTFVSTDGTNKTMQGNIGMSAIFPDFGKVMKKGAWHEIEFVSMSAEKFESPDDAATAVNAGFCDFTNIDRVVPAGILGAIMLSNEYEWRSFAEAIYVKSYF